IRLISSTPQLSTWLNNHPKKNDKSANLWINTGTKNHNKPMKYPNFRRVLKALFKEAGIQKRCNPHMFRHSRATFMAHHLTEFQMNQYFGWVQGSDMPSTYVHMSGREVEKAIMTMNGIQTEETKKEAIIQPMVCPRCDTINAHDSIHCNKCAGILDLKYAMELEDNMQGQNKINDMMRALLEDKNMVQMLAQKMNELGLNKVS
ncbi:MAG: tyrosine-type recombinase/integrase, partial [Candidatus Nanoarchaeia archaeon]